MKRKHAQLKINAATAAEGALPSPSSAGAMDSLLEKLRAAAPQTRDQRDRRRRARLKDRHQVRIASGQKIPDLNEIPEIEAGLQRARSAGSGQTDDNGNPLSPSSLASPRMPWRRRAALCATSSSSPSRGDGTDEANEEKRESLRRARRQTAEDERSSRRRRREKAQSSTSQGEGESRDETMLDADGPDLPTPIVDETIEE